MLFFNVSFENLVGLGPGVVSLEPLPPFRPWRARGPANQHREGSLQELRSTFWGSMKQHGAADLPFMVDIARVAHHLIYLWPHRPLCDVPKHASVGPVLIDDGPARRILIASLICPMLRDDRSGIFYTVGGCTG